MADAGVGHLELDVAGADGGAVERKGYQLLCGAVDSVSDAVSGLGGLEGGALEAGSELREGARALGRELGRGLG